MTEPIQSTTANGEHPVIAIANELALDYGSGIGRYFGLIRPPKRG
jgi:hypothetical protein